MTIGIISALKIESELIIAKIENPAVEVHGGVTFTSGMIGDKKVVCSVCGVGKVFAAMCTEAMILSYSPDCIINTGVGGTLTDALSIGDIAVSRDVVQYDMDTTAVGDPLGLLSGINIVNLPASSVLGDAFVGIADSLGIKTVLGTVATGDRFVADSATKKHIVDSFSAIACEMEGGAVGHVAYVNRVPFVILRTISDGADEGAVFNYGEFVKKASENSALALLRLIAEVPEELS